MGFGLERQSLCIFISPQNHWDFALDSEIKTK